MARFNGFSGEYTGLDNQQVSELQLKYGKNEINFEKKHTFFSKALSLIKEPMFILLFCTAFIYFFLQEYRDGIIMLIFVLFIAGINLYQEWKTDKTLEALKDLSAPNIRVIRNETLIEIKSSELVPSDIMLLEEGEKIPADGIIKEMFDLGVDESSLTGESDVVWKEICIDDAKSSDDHWKLNYCYAGTSVTQGTALVEITATGKETENGKIGVDIASVPENPTPLQTQTGKLVKVCTVIGIVLFIIVAGATFFLPNEISITHRISDSILRGITLAMAMIPEEFPVILTVFLALGAARLAKKNALIRRIPAVETLGAITVLCVDKTGTLTKNQMTVQDTYIEDYIEPRNFMRTATMACERTPFDPMEKAILEYTSLEVDTKSVINNKLLFEYSFSSETKMMGHVWEVDSKPYLAAKGAPERILELCALTDEVKDVYLAKMEDLASNGYRIIAVAQCKDMPTIPQTLEECTLQFMGFLGLEDPPHDVVPESVKNCYQAGVRVVMITGDSKATATSIARKIGFKNCDKAISGEEINKMTDEELALAVRDINIFARVIPNQKMKIVKALKANGEIVAMTGDGVNDAPALKYADIGIAMGKRGTNVAKEAAHMVLLDDNFSTIADTIRDGRRIYDNIKKSIGYVLVVHIPIALLALVNPFLFAKGELLLLLPINIVLLELIIDPTCSIVFERYPAEKNIMRRKPRKPDDPLLSNKVILKSLIRGITIFAAAIGCFLYFWDGISALTPSFNEARTVMFICLVVSNLFLVYSDKDRMSLKGMFSNFDKVTLIINLTIVAMIAIVVYVPFMNSIVKTAPVSIKHLLVAVVAAAVAVFWWDLWKGTVLRHIRKK